MNPILGWKLDLSAITLTGSDLRRPECVLHDDNGDLWVADLGGMMQIRPDGTQSRLRAADGAGGPYAPTGPGVLGIDISANAGLSLPNGMCFDGDDGFLIANFGTNVIERLGRDGRYELILDAIGGQGLGKANFPAIDSAGRLWFTVTASVQDWRAGPGALTPSGYIAVLDEHGPRIVADQLRGTNELRFDPDEEWLYVAETAGDHITRFRIGPNAILSDREIYGPDKLGGLPDGFAFDEAGNLWTTLIGADRLVVLTPEGDVVPIWQDGDPAQRAAGVPGGLDAQPGDGLAPRMASVTFGGPEMRTVYIGSLVGTALPTFTAPVPGRIEARHTWQRP